MRLHMTGQGAVSFYRIPVCIHRLTKTVPSPSARGNALNDLTARYHNNPAPSSLPAGTCMHAYLFTTPTIYELLGNKQLPVSCISLYNASIGTPKAGLLEGREQRRMCICTTCSCSMMISNRGSCITLFNVNPHSCSMKRRNRGSCICLYNVNQCGSSMKRRSRGSYLYLYHPNTVDPSSRRQYIYY